MPNMAIARFTKSERFQRYPAYTDTITPISSNAFITAHIHVNPQNNPTSVPIATTIIASGANNSHQINDMRTPPERHRATTEDPLTVIKAPASTIQYSNRTDSTDHGSMLLHKSWNPST